MVGSVVRHDFFRFGGWRGLGEMRFVETLGQMKFTCALMLS